MECERFSDEQVMAVLKHVAGGVPVSEFSWEHGMCRASFYKWGPRRPVIRQLCGQRGWQPTSALCDSSANP